MICDTPLIRKQNASLKVYIGLWVLFLCLVAYAGAFLSHHHYLKRLKKDLTVGVEKVAKLEKTRKRAA